jgi:hypothetical protein
MHASGLLMMPVQVDNGHYGLLDIGSALLQPCGTKEWKGVTLRVPGDVEGVLRHRWGAGGRRGRVPALRLLPAACMQRCFNHRWQPCQAVV